MTNLYPSIQEFYKGKTILITGATGFLGICLVEKLLRSCNEIHKIILPIRAKRNETIEERKQTYLSNEIFEAIKENDSSIINKIILLESNLEDKNFGLSDSNYEFVINYVNIIFHLAASVELAATLEVAVNSNIKVTQNVINMAKEMLHLQALVHVSTAWSHYTMDFTEEKVYNLSYKPEFLFNLLDNLDADLLTKITPIILNKTWPNVYVLTKNIAECLIKAEKDNLPVAIFRPGIITAAFREPVEGWSCKQTIIVFGIRLATGIIKVFPSNPKHNAHLVPVDFATNCMVAIAWYQATQNGDKNFKVYNFIPMTNPIPRKQFYDGFTYTKYPLDNIVWKPGYVTETNKWWFSIYKFWYETLPAHICDLFMRIITKKPIYVKMVNSNKKLYKFCQPFAIPNFKFEYKNVPMLWKSLNPDDQKLFNFDLDSIDWDEYMDVFTKGARRLLNEDLNRREKC